jgi:tetratricopeptide (TPR) repeat protein
MPQLPETPEAFSIYGDPLHKKPIMLWLPSDKEAYQEKLNELKANHRKAVQEYQEEPDNPEKLLWLGRRTGILGNFMEATALYSKGIERWPDDPRFLRFRGHRFALLRRLDLAIDDLRQASIMIQDKPDEPELYASGGPSRDKLGVASFQWNVWYHLGFVYFAAGRHEEAADAYRKCLTVSNTMEARVATSHWYYMVLLRLGRQEAAAKLLEDINEDMDLVEVGDYYETLLMYKGHTSPEQLLKKARDEGPVNFVTRAHTVGNLYLANGEEDKAVEIFREILGTGIWTAGVFLMAEKEIMRLGLLP